MTPRVESIVRLFTSAGLDTEATGSILDVIWNKLLANVAVSALSAVTRLPPEHKTSEIPFPDAYGEIRDCLGHVHIKDCRVDISRATVRFCALGKGDMALYLDDIVGSLNRDGYRGVVSYESVYRPDGGSFEDGFRESLPVLKNYLRCAHDYADRIRRAGRQAIVPSV